MGLRINRRQARWVIWIFQQVAAGRSINWIARELTRRKVPRDRRAWSHVWFAPTIRKMLSNVKFIGLWIWGATMTVRDSTGRKKQVAVAECDRVVTERSELRIVSQELWEKVQERLAKLRQKTGYKPGQAGRTPMMHYSKTHPSDLLATLLRCGYCGATMHHAGSKTHVYRECSNGADGRDACREKARVPAAKAKGVLLEFIGNLLTGMPDWIANAVEEMHSAIHEFHARVPAELEELREQLRDAEQRRGNLMRIAESGGVDDLEDFKRRLRAAEEDVKMFHSDTDRMERVSPAQVDMPDNEWFQARLKEIATTLQSDEGNVAELLRALIGEVHVFRIVPFGKQVGYQQLRFRINTWKVVREALRGTIPTELLDLIDKDRSADGDLSPEFVLDVGGPHRLDVLAPRIAELRSQGMKWKDIATETGVSMDSAWHCWRRYVDALAASTPPPTRDRSDEPQEDVCNEDEDLNKGQGAA
jgi:site-specific DNA recombinase